MKKCVVLVCCLLLVIGKTGFVWSQEEDVNAYKGETTALMRAIWNGNIKKIRSLLDRGADPNLLRKGGDNIIVPISMAAVNQGLSHVQVAEIVKLLIDHGAKLELKDNTYGYTPLMWMIIYNQPEAVKVLMDAGASLEAKDNNGQTPLSLASKEGRLEIVKLLSFAKNADPVALEKSLCNAIWQKHTDVIMDLMAQVKTLPACALNQAVIRDEEDIVAALLDAGADPNASDGRGTPLMEAIDKNNVGIVSLLLQKKADPEGKAMGEWTPLIRAAYHGHRNIVKVLLEAHVNVDAKAQYETALQVAVKQGHEDVALMLIDAGADVVDNFTRNWEAMHTAAGLGMVKVIEAMLRKGADVDARNNNDMTPLMVACEQGRLEAVKMLLEHKADIEAQNANRPVTDFGDNFIGTPLMWARHGGHQDIVDFLLSKGANAHPQVKPSPIQTGPAVIR